MLPSPPRIDRQADESLVPMIDEPADCRAVPVILSPTEHDVANRVIRYGVELAEAQIGVERFPLATGRGEIAQLIDASVIHLEQMQATHNQCSGVGVWGRATRAIMGDGLPDAGRRISTKQAAVEIFGAQRVGTPVVTIAFDAVGAPVAH